MIYRYSRPDPDPWPDAVRVDGWPGVEFWVLGEQVEQNEDGDEVPTGKLVVMMVGGIARYLADPDGVQPLGAVGSHKPQRLGEGA